MLNLMPGWRPPPPQTKQLLMRLEGCKKIGYADIAGIPTGGIGHTGHDVVVGKQYTDEQIEVWYEHDVISVISTLYHYVPASIINQLPVDSYAALITFLFNVGPQAFTDPKTLKPTNFRRTLLSENWPGVAERMKDWDKARVNGQLVPVAGLIQRRAIEASMWTHGFSNTTSAVGFMSDADTIPVPDLDTNASVQPAFPDAPPQSTASRFGQITAGLGAAAAVTPDIISPDQILQQGSQILSMGVYAPAIAKIGVFLIIFGVGIMVYQQIRAQQRKGA